MDTGGTQLRIAVAPHAPEMNAVTVHLATVSMLHDPYHRHSYHHAPTLAPVVSPMV